MTAPALLALALALAADGIASDGGPDAPRLVYELDVAKPGEPSLAPLPEPELASRLTTGGFDLLVLWLAADDPAGDGFPDEPRARLLDATAPAAAALAPIVAPFRGSLAIAVGRRRQADVGGLPAIQVDRELVVEIPGSSPRRFLRFARPAVRTLLWSRRPPELDAAPAAWGAALSSRLLNPTAPGLRAVQARLDLAAFRGDAAGDPARPLLLAQSALASYAADVVAGDDPQAYLPIENEWLGAAPLGRLPVLRRGDPLLDLEEICFSLARDGTPFLRRVAVSDATDPPTRGSLVDTFVDPDPSASFADRAQLSREELRAFEAILGLHLQAAAAYGAFLARGIESDRAAARAALDEIEKQLPAIGDRAAPWRRTLDADRALLRVAEPWRIRRQTWTIASSALPTAAPAAPARTVTLSRVDDPRVGAFADPLERALGGRAIDLWNLLAVRVGLDVTLRTEVALRDPRNIRLRVDAGGRCSVRVNGAVQIDAYPGERGPLLTTIPLPAGTNVIELRLTLDGTRGDVGLDLDLLPSRVEGIVLDPERASRVHEPVVRLRDPTALREMVLVRPSGRGSPVGSADGARASLPFTLVNDARLDAWVHALPLADRASRLELCFDDGARCELDLPQHAGWLWVRAAAPATVRSGDHALHVDFPVENVRVDQVVLLPSELTFPRPPANGTALAATAWRFDPLGAGLVVDLPLQKSGDLFGRSFVLDKGGTYDAFVWLKGSDPLAPGQWSELELNMPSGRQRFVLPAGTPYEEWVPLGNVVFTADERIELRAQGNGALARVVFVR